MIRRPARYRFSQGIEQLEIRVVPTTDLMSVNVGGDVAGNDVSYGVPEFDESRDPVRMLSGDGRYVVFTSNARNISESPIAFDGDLNQGNIYVRDRLTGVTTMVNVSVDGQGYGDAADPSITPDGRFVVFTGASYDGQFDLSPLVANVTFPPNITVAHQLYVRDLQTGITTLVSVRPDGIGSAGNDDDVGFHSSLSADGSKVVFVGGANDDLVAGDHNGRADIFVRDLISGTTILISQNVTGTNSGNGASYFPTISADGSRVTFMSEATDLTDIPDTNGRPDLFSYSFADGSITLISTNADGTAASNAGVQNMYRADDSGTRIAYLSCSTDLVDAAGLDLFNVNFFFYDLATSTTTLLSHGPSGEARETVHGEIGLSRDGTTATFAGNGGYIAKLPEGVKNQIYVVDTATGKLTLGSRGADGTAANSDSARATLSADGRYVLFSSSATNLAPQVSLGIGPDDSTLTLFVFDRLTSTTWPVSVNPEGTTTISTDGQFAGYYAISRDGSAVAFTSLRGGYGTSDSNDVADVYAIDQTPLPPNALPEVLDAVFSLAENSAASSVVGTAQASDPDAGDTITFLIVAGNQSGAFAIDSATGKVTVANASALDFEKTTSFTLTIQVTDNHGAAERLTATIKLTDVEEHFYVSNGGSSVTWRKKGPAVKILPNATVTGAAVLNGGFLTIRVNAVMAGKKLVDLFTLPSANGLGTVLPQQISGGQVIFRIQLAPVVNTIDVQSFLRGITFATKGKGINIPKRNVQVTLTGNGLTGMIPQTITVANK